MAASTCRRWLAGDGRQALREVTGLRDGRFRHIVAPGNISGFKMLRALVMAIATILAQSGAQAAGPPLCMVKVMNLAGDERIVHDIAQVTAEIRESHFADFTAMIFEDDGDVLVSVEDQDRRQLIGVRLAPEIHPMFTLQLAGDVDDFAFDEVLIGCIPGD